MAQNIFTNPEEARKKRQNGQVPVSQTAGFGGQISGGDAAAGRGYPEAQSGYPAITQASPLSSGQAPPPAAPRASATRGYGQGGQGMPSPIQGFGDGFRSELPNLPQEAQQRWQDRGIDFDGLLKFGVGRSMEDEAIARTTWLDKYAQDMVAGRMQMAAEQARPQQIARSQDVDILRELNTMRMMTLDPNQRAMIDQSINELMVKLGMSPLQPQGQPQGQGQMQGQPQVMSTGFDQNVGGGMGEAAGPANVDGMGGAIKSFVSSLIPTGAAMALPAALSKVLSKAPHPALKLAGNVGAGIVGAMGGEALTDTLISDNVQARQAHPFAALAGAGAGFAAPWATRFMGNVNKVNQGMMSGFGGPRIQPPRPQVPIKPSENFTPPPMQAAPLPTANPVNTQAGYGGFGNYRGPNPATQTAPTATSALAPAPAPTSVPKPASKPTSKTAPKKKNDKK